MGEFSLRKSLANGSLVFGGLLLSLAAAEMVARKYVELKPEPDYIETIENTALNKERLWAPNLDVEYDIRGLYRGATKARLRTSAQRFIEPQPAGKRKFQVLFLGGSTTESLYVPENERWVAALNRGGAFDAYNAGQSGANTVDAYYAYRYLTEVKKMRFDQVVLMTAINDLSWEISMSRVGQHLSTNRYHEALSQYYLFAYKDNLTLPQRCSSHLALCELIKRVQSVRRDRQLVRNVADRVRGREVGNVTANYLQSIPQSKREFELEELRDVVDGMLAVYESNAAKNIAALREAVSSNGAKLMVLSEPSSYGADPESFHVDLRLT